MTKLKNSSQKDEGKMDYLSRVSKLRKVLSEQNVEGLLIEDPIDLYYLTGIELSTGKLVVMEETAYLIVDGRYVEKCKTESLFPVLLYQDEKIFEKKELLEIDRLAFDSSKTSYQSYLSLKKHSKKELVPVDAPTRAIRVIKDSDEIALLREAADLGSQGYDYLCGLLQPGITEAELAIELEIFWKRRGSKALGFDPIIAFGKNSSMPHYRCGNVPLKKGDPVLIDIGVNLNHYHSDMTRVQFLGDPEPKMREIYQIVHDAQEMALALCKPGTKIGDLDAVAREYIESKGYGEEFSHSLGHGIGLEIHEAPTVRNKKPYSESPLEKGMVITVEPGIYLPGIGGVRIEDTVVITDDGHENLTNREKAL